MRVFDELAEFGGWLKAEKVVGRAVQQQVFHGVPSVQCGKWLLLMNELGSYQATLERKII
jgi:hypothetical protein